MSEEGEEEKFWLYAPGVINLLEDRDYFVRAISQFYFKIASQSGWLITISERRLWDAHDLWQTSAQAALDYDTDQYTKTLDHFKHAAFIAFWLQRSVTISEMVSPSAGEAKPTTETTSAKQIHFARYGNEICALYTGFLICLSYETNMVANKQKVAPSDISLASMPGFLQSEYPRLMKHKEVSAHALYMVFRSLFETLEWEVTSPEAGTL